MDHYILYTEQGHRLATFKNMATGLQLYIQLTKCTCHSNRTINIVIITLVIIGYRKWLVYSMFH